MSYSRGEPTPRCAHPSRGGDSESRRFLIPLHGRGGRRPGWVLRHLICEVADSDTSESQIRFSKHWKKCSQALESRSVAAQTFSKHWKTRRNPKDQGPVRHPASKKRCPVIRERRGGSAETPSPFLKRRYGRTFISALQNLLLLLPAVGKLDAVEEFFELLLNVDVVDEAGVASL